MGTLKRHLWLTVVIGLYVTGCSGSALTGSTLDAGPGANTGICSGDPRGGAEVPNAHRPTATACGPSSRSPAVPDGGTAECATSADCASDAGSYFTICLRGRCSFDQCLTDGDCGADSACVCGDTAGGNALYHANYCIAAKCRVDADCGSGGYCSPGRSACGTVEGFYCHSKADTCVDELKDCAGCGNTCLFAPTLGAFVCGSLTCAG